VVKATGFGLKLVSGLGGFVVRLCENSDPHFSIARTVASFEISLTILLFKPALVRVFLHDFHRQFHGLRVFTQSVVLAAKLERHQDVAFALVCDVHCQHYRQGKARRSRLNYQVKSFGLLNRYGAANVFWLW
jgi:hypothetical protein